MMPKPDHEVEIAPTPARVVTLAGHREVLPVTRISSIATLRVVNGVLTTVRVLKAA